MKPTLLILAAGIGSRYGGLKQLDAVGPSGETIIDYSIYDALRAGFGKVVFIIKEAIEDDFKAAFVERLRDRVAIDYVFQETWMVPEGVTIPDNRSKPWGTGHAVLMAKGKIDGPFAVINADDFYGRGAFEAIARYYEGWTPARENDYSMVGFRLENTLSEFGTVSRGVCTAGPGGLLAGVTERTRIARDEAGQITYTDEAGKDIALDGGTVVSMNFWGFTPSFFGQLEQGFSAFIARSAGDLKAEYYIPSAVNDLVAAGASTVKLLHSPDAWFGMTYREDRPRVVGSIRALTDAGVYPENLWG